MKLIKLLALCLAVMILLCSCGVKNGENLISEDILVAKTTENDIFSSEYFIVSESDNYSLWFNENTTSVKVIDKKDGYEWQSCLSVENAVSEKNAPFTLTYLNESGLIETMNAMEHSIVNGQYTYEQTERGIDVTYSIGDFTGELKVPLAVSLERMEFILSSIEDEFEKMQFESMYQLTDSSQLEGENKKLFLKNFPSLKDGPLYILRETISTSEQKMKELSELLSAYGYTTAMYEEDVKLLNIGGEEDTSVKPGFRVVMKYVLTDDGLEVTVPSKEIQMKSECPLISIELNKYMGSPTEQDEGYFLLPDGSGSLMNFYNGMGDLQDYNTKVYGPDYASQPDEMVYSYEQSYLPLWGIKKGDHAMLGVIAEGDAITEINAFPGNELLRGYAAPTFVIRSYQKTYLSSDNANSNYFVNLQNNRYDGNIRVKYVFLSGEDANYLGMADWYRDYLFDADKSVNEGTPGMILECIGLLETQTQVFGIGYDKNIVATTFSDTESIASELDEAGITNLSIKLSGWANGPYFGGYSKGISVNRNLDGEEAFRNLSSYLKNKNIDFYPTAELQYTYRDKWFDGFSVSSDAVGLINRAVGYKISYNPATFAKDSNYKATPYINNLNAVNNGFSGFFKDYKKYGITGVSLGSLGRELSADYSDKNGTDRQKFMSEFAKNVAGISSDYKLMTTGANAYLLNYIDYCTDVPLISNERDNTNESVPFLQMVLSGKVKYSGPIMNFTGKSDTTLLRMAQVAADISYQVAGRNVSELSEGEYSFLYSVDYKYLKDDILKTVKEYQQNLNGLSGRKIVGYQKLTDHLYRTIFEGGATVTVNYSENDINFENTVYEKLSYTVKEGTE